MEANQITVRLGDEEYVRSVWDFGRVGIYGYGGTAKYLNFSLIGKEVMGANEAQMWELAAEYTRERLEQVRQLKFDIAHVTKFRNGVGAYCHQHPYTTQTLEVEIPNLESWKRILARLEAALATLTRGIRPEALEGSNTMKAADGTKIAEIVRYWTTCEDGIHGMDPAPQGKGNWVRYTDHLAALSAAEERERVLRDALAYPRFGDTATLFERCVEMLLKRDAELSELKGEQWDSLYIHHFRGAIANMRAALATPAPEQPAVDTKVEDRSSHES